MRLGYCFLVLFFSWVLLLAAERCLAETRYISDVLHVNLLAGKGQGEKLKLLKSNDPVEVVEETDGFVRVRTEDGTVGWVSARFVMDAQPKTQIIHELQLRLADTESRLAALSSSSRHGGGEQASAAAAAPPRLPAEPGGWPELARRYEELLSKSRRAVELVEQFDTLKSSYDRLSGESDGLRVEVKRLQRQRDILWFLAGSGVFGAGWLAGKLSSRRKQFSL